MILKDIKSKGKLRKTKAYGLVGCLAFSLGLAGSVVLESNYDIANAAVVDGGRDIKDSDVNSTEASGVAMTYTRFDSNGSPQTASGSGVFIAPNIMVTVAHNYLDKDKSTGSGYVRGGNSAQSYVVMNSNSEKNGNNITSGNSELIERGNIHYYNQGEFAKSYTNDLAVVVVDKPVEALSGGTDHARALGVANNGDAITMLGYPNDFTSKNLAGDVLNRLKNGKLYSVTGTISNLTAATGEGDYHMTALGGFSGGPLFNNKGEVVGIHQHGTNVDSVPEAQQHGSGLFFTEKHRAWLKEMVDKYAIKGWYVNGNDKFYYDDNHQPLVNTTRDIDGAKYSFDSNGRGTLVSGVEKGQLMLQYFDKQGEKLFERVVSKGNVGEAINYDFKKDNGNKEYFAKNPDAKVVSVDGEVIDKKFTDNWSKDYSSKYKLGNTVIKVVVEGATNNKFNRTEPGQVDDSGGVNLPKMSDDVKNVPNGPRNFNATVAIATEAGLGSGTLINEDTIVSVAHNFVHLNTKTNPITVVNNVNKTGDVHIATLPDGRQVKFSNDDVKFWNRDGFVNGFKNDLVVIKLKNKFTGETPALVHDGVTNLAKGDKVHVFGYPKGKLNPILNGNVENVENYGSNIMGIAYQGSAPGMSGGGMYNAQGELIGVHQNGVEGLRSGGITFSKEQLDWINALARGENVTPVYLPDEPRNDDKDKDKGKHGKLLEVDDQSSFGWIGELYEDGTYVIKGVKDKNVELSNPNGGVQSIFDNDSSKVNKIKRIEIDGTLKADLFDLGSYIHPTEIDLTGLTLSDKSGVPFLVYRLGDLTALTLGKDFKLVKDSTLSRLIDGAPKLKLTNEQVTQILKDLVLVGNSSYGGPLLRNVGVERLDLSTFDNSKIDPRNYNPYSGRDENGKEFKTKSVFKDLIGLKEVVFGDKFDFEKYARKNTPDAFMDTDLSGVEKVTFAGNKPSNDKFVKDWLEDVQKLNDKNKQGLYRDGKYSGKVVDTIQADKTYEDGVYTLGPVMAEKPADKVVTEVIEPTVEYVGDDSLEKDSPKVRIDGKAGSKVITTTYVEDGKGGYKEKVLDPVITPATKTIIKVGTRPTVVTTHTEPVVVYEPDVTRDRGTPDEKVLGTRGTTIVTTMYKVDATTGDVTEVKGQPIVTPATNTIIRVGVKDKVELIKGSGKTIEKRTVYTLDRVTGNVTEKVTMTELKVDVTYKADDTLEYGKRVVSDDGSVVTIGTKPTELVEEIEPDVVYEADLTREKGLANLVTNGIAGKKVTTIKHSVDEKTGEITEDRQEPVITPATKTVVKVAAQPHVVTKAIPKGKVYVADNKRDFGTDNVVVDGKDGVSITTTSFEVDPTTGVITGRTAKPIVTEPTMTMVYVGTKSITREVKGDDGLTYEELTEYSIDKDTGVVTPKVTRKLKGDTSTVPVDTPKVDEPKQDVPTIEKPKVDEPINPIPIERRGDRFIPSPTGGMPVEKPGNYKVDEPIGYTKGEDLYPDNTLVVDNRPPYLEKKLTLDSPVFEGKYKALPKTGLNTTSTTAGAVILMGIAGFLARKKIKKDNSN